MTNILRPRNILQSPSQRASRLWIKSITPREGYSVLLPLAFLFYLNDQIATVWVRFPPLSTHEKIPLCFAASGPMKLACLTKALGWTSLRSDNVHHSLCRKPWLLGLGQSVIRCVTSTGQCIDGLHTLARALHDQQDRLTSPALPGMIHKLIKANCVFCL